MSDRLFEHAVHDWLGDGSDRTPSRAIDSVLFAIKSTPQQRALRTRWRFPQMTISRRLVATAIAVVAVVGGGAIWYIGQSTHPSPPTSTRSPVPSFAPSSTASPSAAASPSAEADTVKGWPGNRGGSAPGLYSWDEVRCEPTNCVMGVIHRHFGNDPDFDVRIVIARIPDWSVDASATPVTVAGHLGRYQRTNAELEVWNVDFGGTLVSISLSVKGGASKAVVDEAHSIIDSLVYEPRDTPLGFRLVFRLVSEVWDSPY